MRNFNQVKHKQKLIEPMYVTAYDEQGCGRQDFYFLFLIKKKILAVPQHERSKIFREAAPLLTESLVSSWR